MYMNMTAMILHYLKIAVRQLLKCRTQNLISIAGLAICLLCFSVCLYVARFILSTDDCFPLKERIAEVSLRAAEEERGFFGIPPELIRRLRGIQSHEAETYTYVSYSQSRTFSVEVSPEEMLPFDPLTCMEVDSCFRRVFGLDIVAGSWEAAVQTPNSLILSESLARRIYGENVADALGRRFQTTARNRYSRRAGDASYTVQAVMADLPRNNSLTFMEDVGLLLLNDGDGRLQDSSTDYTGGMGYGGVTDAAGNIIGDTSSGLPKPGYHITLPAGLADELGLKDGIDLAKALSFSYSGTDELTGEAQYMEFAAYFLNERGTEPLFFEEETRRNGNIGKP